VPATSREPLKNLERFRGIGQFGPAYRVMLENDPNAQGSVDRVLAESMVKLCSKTAGYLYKAYTPLRVSYRKGTRLVLESYAKLIAAGCSSDEEIIEGIALFTSCLQDEAEDDLDRMKIGGLEEDIIKRGSEWCIELARVGCVLCQVAGLPARLVMLADTGNAYNGHAVIEVYRAATWGAVDTTTNVVYRHLDGKPASTWDLMKDARLVRCHWRNESTLYTRPEQFKAATITNYFVWLWKDYDYAVSGVNDYYRSILNMASKGWPGGLRWLHGEDKSMLRANP